MYGSLFKTPQWMMWGVENDDGTVTLIATKKLDNYALAMSYEADVIGIMSGIELQFHKPVIEGHGKCREFEMITANTYAEAMHQLFEKWAESEQRVPLN